MEINEVINLLCTQIPNENILMNEPMKNHTSFKIGGPADLFVMPTDCTQLVSAVQLCNAHNIPYYIVGNGSNLLIDDKGFRGVIIQLYKNLSDIEIEDTVITADSGALLSKIANVAFEHGLAGFEFAQGIPGTLGGAVAMNAGAYGGEIQDVIIDAQVIDQKGQKITLSKEDLALGYRTSIIQKNKYIVLKARLLLSRGSKTAISEIMKDLAGRRRDKQPLEKPSAGSTFKRPEGYFAGKLIMDAGLRGYQIGGAMVSTKHCGFVVSDGTATFKDVKALIDHIQLTVKEKFNVDLQPEIKIISNQG
ncbi:UDP-N-acetylmuramate dehydrogenase [Cellulosilyticum sp. I15G10I2]|uniref:UDP-N-acetylmuramate dehydrogenase n=1 Tax=Cellulosilyticum sp. I15G10I2 TaxID=1892843 RepID=UPI00085BEE17|nr:UDP-N-acetylmuramate dehydrogenase [Cellulosilyticum sp. I15G10I2]